MSNSIITVDAQVALAKTADRLARKWRGHPILGDRAIKYREMAFNIRQRAQRRARRND